REREPALGETMVLVLRVGARRLAERHVEEQPADARDVAVDAVEHLAALLVAIEAGADVMTQIPPGLREADGQRVANRAAGDFDSFRIVLQPADEIAGGGETQALDLRVPGLVGEFVEAARFGLVLELDRAAV